MKPGIHVLADPTGVCAACRTRQHFAALEMVPTQPHLLRCQDEEACRKRYTPRRLALSVRDQEDAP